MEMLKAIKFLLKTWNKDVFGRVEENKKSALTKVAAWDNIESKRPLSSEEVRTGIVNAFKSLLSDPSVWKASPEGLDFSSLDDFATFKLEEPFTEEGVYSALLNLNGDKALGPDGFIAAFWQFSWDFVKMDIMDLFKDLGKV